MDDLAAHATGWTAGGGRLASGTVAAASPGMGTLAKHQEVPVAEARLEELSPEECARLLRTAAVGRVGVVADGFPVVVPVNYRVIEDDEGLGLVLRARTGGVVDHPGTVAFEVDGIDPLHRLGWSVLVRGVAAHIDEAVVERLGGDIDPGPRVAGRDAWLIVRPFAVTGRRLQPPEIEWVLGVVGYL